MAAALAWPLMRVTAPGLSAASVDLAADLARIMFIVVPLVALAEVLRALLNALGSFFAPAAMNVVMNGLAAGVILWRGDGNVRLIATAYALGAFAQLVFMVVAAYRKGFRFHASAHIRDPDVVAAGRLSVRPLVGAGLNPLARVGEQLFVSFLPAGSITILNYGYRLVSAIGGTVLFRSVMVVLLAPADPRHRRGRRARRPCHDQARAADPARDLGGAHGRDGRAGAPGRARAVPSGQLLERRRHDPRRRARGLRGQHHRLGRSSGACWRRSSPSSTRGSRCATRVYGVIANLALVPICMLPFGRHDPRRGHRRGGRVLDRAVRERGAHLVPPAARPGHPLDGDGRARSCRSASRRWCRAGCCSSATGCSTLADRTSVGVAAPDRRARTGGPRGLRRGGVGVAAAGHPAAPGVDRRRLARRDPPGSGSGAATATSRSSRARGRCGASSSATRRRGGA